MKLSFALVAASVLALPLVVVAQTGTGLTLSLCTTSTDCKAPRQCYDATTTTTLSQCTSTAENPSLCACQPAEIVNCSAGKPCSDGETCARTLNSSNYCADPAVVEQVPDLFPANKPLPTIEPEDTAAPVWQAIAKKPVGDSCTTPLQCGDNLYCLAFTGAQPGTPFCAEGDTCRCVPRSTIKCVGDDDCASGSTCVGVDGGATVCLEPEVVEEVPGLLPVASISPLPSPAAPSVPRETPAPEDAPESPIVTPAPTEDAETPSSSPTTSVDASPAPSVKPAPSSGTSSSPAPATPSGPAPATPSGPAPATPSGPAPATPSGPALATPSGPVPATPVAAADSESTQEPEATGEATAEVSGSPTPNAESAEDDVSATPTPVCIAAHHLEGHDSLVFDKHFHTTVLCDAQHSCATATHIVVFNGKPMSMHTYCKSHAPCVEKAMLVNSPKYSRKLRVPSRTDGLEFTAFAARFGTKVEEHVLSAAVRLSL